MENERAAKFFIGTFLEQDIESLEVKPQEYTYEGELDFSNPKDVQTFSERLKERYTIRVYRLDFVAVVRTKSGERKKILIEIQKAHDEVDILRFRNYLAEQYKRQDAVDGQAVTLPITTIYILGTNLSNIPSPCVKVERQYLDMLNKEVIAAKSDFIEQLTHDSYVVQIRRISGRYRTRLEQVLSIFEQRHFLDDNQIIKDFPFQPDMTEMRIITDILHHAGTDPAAKKLLEAEQEAWRTIEAVFAPKEKKYQQQINEQQQALAEKEQALQEQKQALQEQQRVNAEKEQALQEQQRVNAEKDRIIAELLKKLNSD